MLAVGLATSACADDETPASGTQGAGGMASGPGPGGAGGGGASGTGGAIPDTECASTTAEAVELYPKGTSASLDRVAVVGTRLVASGEAGIVFFDEDGQNVDPTPTVLRASRHVAASEGDTVAVAAYDDDWLSVQRLDEAGGAVTALGGVTHDFPQVTSIASASWGSPLVWAYNTRLLGRTLTPSGTFATDPYDVALGAFSTFVFLESGVRGDEIGVVWSGDENLGANQSFFTRIASDGPTGERSIIHETAGSHNVTAVVGIDTGYLVMFTGEPPDYAPAMLRIGLDGFPKGDPIPLAGARFGHGMASHGDRVAVVAGRETGEIQMRALASDLSPMGPWVCLGPDFDPDRPAAITAQGSGYAVVYTSLAGASIYHRTDDTGQGAQ